MKSIFTLLLIGLLYSANAKTYYFSASGNDSYSSTQAQNQSTPWKTIKKLNAIFSTLQPGDKVLFKRGDIFYGSIIIAKSGTSSSPITIGAYGSGAKPIITGFLTVSKWTSIGGGKYESNNSGFGSSVNMVAVNGFPKEIGRYPNSDASLKGYLYFESHGTNSITDNELSSSPDWTGAELVVRTSHWIIDRLKVTDQSGRTIKYSPSTSSSLSNGYGYFFQNDLRTLDRSGEWYYKPSTKYFYMYFGSSSPSNYKVQVSAVDDLIYLYNYDNLVFDNLSLQGANKQAVYVYSADNIHVQNCDISLSGVYGVWAQNTNALTVENCKINYTNNIGIFLYSNTDGSIVRNNEIRTSGIFAGMAQNGSNQACGVRVNGNNNLVEYNRIDSSGYNGIRFTGDYVTIKNNFITNFNFVRDDGAGIYTSNSGDGDNYGRKIIGNIIINGLGAKEGTPNESFQTSSGIYIDDNSANVTITGNTVANCGKVGLFIHDSYKITATNNTLYDNDQAQTQLCHGSPDKPTLRNIVFRNNILVSKTTSQWVAFFDTRDNDISKFGAIDSNYYARPIDDNVTIQERTALYTSSQVTTKHTLSTWHSKYSIYDKNSKKSSKTLSSTADPNKYIRFEYNASKVNKTITLNTTYYDVKKKLYSGTITLAPYTSIVLIMTGAPTVSLTSPKVNATYSAPASVQISASASDIDGKISKVEFFKNSTLIKTLYSSPYSFTLSNVAAGSYTLTAKATDNAGNATLSDPVSFTVKKSSTTSATVSNDASMETMDTTVAISETMVSKEVIAQPSFDFRVYPNPATNRIYVAINNGSQISEKGMMTIQNISGSVIQRKEVALSGGQVEVDISSFSSGMYIITISTGKTVSSRKFIKAN